MIIRFEQDPTDKHLRLISLCYIIATEPTDKKFNVVNKAHIAFFNEKCQKKY